MADNKTPDAKDAQTKARSAESQTTPASQSGSLCPAAESSDPAVHQLLAEKQSAQMNDDEEGVRETQRKLAELGYE